MIVPQEPEQDEADTPNAVALLNETISAELMQHRSHSSHSSHSSHRSSSSGGARPAPAPRSPPPQPIYVPPPPEEEVSPPQTSDPLGQEPRPKESIPEPKKPKSVSNLDAEALKNIVMRMQLTLQFEGFYDGPIDGVMGPGTQLAVKAFKKAKKIPGNTVFDRETLNALGITGF
jgi:His-Xaa-Ser repeat protein HxsA